jgi:hypothetical protein
VKARAEYPVVWQPGAQPCPGPGKGHAIKLRVEDKVGDNSAIEVEPSGKKLRA